MNLGFWSGSSRPLCQQLPPCSESTGFLFRLAVLAADQIPELLRTVKRLRASGFSPEGEPSGDERRETAVYFCPLPAERLMGKAVLVLPPLRAGAALVMGDREGTLRF